MHAMYLAAARQAFAQDAESIHHAVTAYGPVA